MGHTQGVRRARSARHGEAEIQHPGSDDRNDNKSEWIPAALTRRHARRPDYGRFHRRLVSFDIRKLELRTTRSALGCASSSGLEVKFFYALFQGHPAVW